MAINYGSYCFWLEVRSRESAGRRVSRGRNLLTRRDTTLEMKNLVTAQPEALKGAAGRTCGPPGQSTVACRSHRHTQP